MPNCQKYMQPKYVYGELDRIIGNGSIRGYIRCYPEIILAPLTFGFFDGLGLQKTSELEIQIQVSDGDLADRVRSMALGMFDFGQRVGKDLLEDKRNGEMMGPEIAAFIETLMGYLLGYVNPKEVYKFKRANRLAPGLAHLLPPEENIN